MAKPWDDAIKRLIHLRPEAFVRLFLPEAHFIEALPPKLRQEEMEMDNLFRTEFQHHPLLMDVEVQTRYDARMPERFLRYNIITDHGSESPRHSCGG